MLLALLLACSPPDATPVTDVLAVASPLTWAGARSAAVAAGLDDVCVIERTPCAGAPCSGAFTAEVSPACPLPFAPEARGEVVVALASADGSSLGFGATFTAVTVDGAPLAVERVEGAWMTLEDADAAAGAPGEPRDLWTLGWADVDVAFLGDASVSVLEGGWVVAAADGGTPDDPADDTFRLDGGSQWAAAGDEGGHVRQTTIVGGTFGPACPLNPTAGTGGIQAVDAGDARTWVDEIVVTFPDRCDGTVDVYSATSGTPRSTAPVGV